MLTIDLEPELEASLKNIAMQEHISLNEIIKQLINQYIRQKQDDEKKCHAKQKLTALMANVPNSISLANELIQERRLEAKIEQQGNN